MHSNYELFIESLKRIASEGNGNVLPEGYETSHLWRYSLELFQDQKEVIEAILALGYAPIYARLRETLSGDYPVIFLHEVEKIEKSYWSGKSDLVPSVTFSNDQENANGDSPILRIEFGNTGIAGID